MGGSASDHGSRHGRDDRKQDSRREHDRQAALRAFDKAARDNRANQLNPQHPAYAASRDHPDGGQHTGTPMTRDDASRIQSNADKHDKNQDFKSRAMSAANKNKDEEKDHD